VYVEGQKLALRGLFIIDPNGVLQYQVVHSLSVGRSTEEILRVLEGLQLGGLCPGERKQGEPVLDLDRELQPNRVFGHYRIEAVLGGGSFGTVYRARDLALDRTVALKVIRPGSPMAPEVLLAEARAAAALTHPNVCMIHAVDSSLGPPIPERARLSPRRWSRKRVAWYLNCEHLQEPSVTSFCISTTALSCSSFSAKGVHTPQW
jgi:serine/threonine protein kinase